MGILGPLPVYVRTLSGRVLFRSDTGSDNCCRFMSVMSMSEWKEFILQRPSLSSGSYLLSASSSATFLEPRSDRYRCPLTYRFQCSGGHFLELLQKTEQKIHEDCCSPGLATAACEQQGHDPCTEHLPSVRPLGTRYKHSEQNPACSMLTSSPWLLSGH